MRVYTFFMYLSTPEAGGGTRFDNLGVIVPAVKGSAVMWPSVTDADPSIDEPHTFHQGLPPEVGTKYAANVWVHNVRRSPPHHTRRRSNTAPPRRPAAALPCRHFAPLTADLRAPYDAVRLSDSCWQGLPAHTQEHALTSVVYGLFFKHFSKGRW